MGAADGFMDSEQLDGLTVYDSDGEKVGSVGRVYVDDATGKPDWITVKTGLFGMKESFVPLAGARRVGTDLHVTHTKDSVKDAPKVDADAHLSVAEEEELYRHYGMTDRSAGTLGQGTAGNAGTTGADGRTATGTAAAAAAGTGAAGTPGNARPMPAADPTAGHGKHRDTAATDRPLAGAGAGAAAMSGRSAADPNRKDELVRSEEQLHVGTEEFESGKARVHKYVVTENVTKTVPVSHEEVRLVREPLQPGEKSVGQAEIGEQDVEVTLHAERATVRKESVPVERVRLETSKVTEQQEVSAEVRKEQIEFADGTEKTRGKDTTRGVDPTRGKGQGPERGGPQR
ncbi:PRC and DUF2382 domain-containing protein [Streptomyces sp. NPDC060194]|uniref:PRC and DUF2382 domain-containing protein n=1 Tax=Streptomyces sp. NPDC060194 TaxID=3347069 RepID=UPI0036504353